MNSLVLVFFFYHALDFPLRTMTIESSGGTAIKAPALHLLTTAEILPGRSIVNQQRHESTVTSVLAFQFLLITCCLVGDYYTIFVAPHGAIEWLERKCALSERAARALLDNAIHFATALIAWLIIAHPILSNASHELLLTGLLASLIDLDHFVEAKSFRLLAACSLPRRPFLHDSYTMLVLNVFLFALLNLVTHDAHYSTRLSLMVFVAWFTHHIRDAYRRGIWFGSLFSTPPIPYATCLHILVCSPIMIRALLVLSAGS